MTKNTKIDTDEIDLVQLISREDVEQEFGEAVASSVSVDNRVTTWAKFILTDDRPNGNRQRIPSEEFDNIMKTGLYKPVKMALGEIRDGHDEALPLGVITHLKREGEKVVALAALWNHERRDDIAQIKKLVNTGKPVNVSWEILYGKERVLNGVKDLLDTILTAVTIVGIPAYAGRTQLLAVAAKKWSPAYMDKLPDSHFLHIDSDGNRYFAYREDTGKIDPARFQSILEEISSSALPEAIASQLTHQVKVMESVINADAGLKELLAMEEYIITEEQKLDTKELESKVLTLETQVAEATQTLATKEADLADALAKVNLANDTIKALEEEIAPLREFKQQADAELDKRNRLTGIRERFGAAGLEKDEEYFNANADKLLKLDETDLEFMLQEMVAFKDGKNGTASLDNGTDIPNVHQKVNSTDLLTMLRERDQERTKK